MPLRLTGGTEYAHPLYKEVRLRITRSLSAGEWKPGEAIPSETQLADRFAVSVGTLRKAIDELVAEKILVRQQGRGTFVASHTEDRNLYYFFHIVGRDGVKQNPVTETLSFERGKADTSEAGKLAIPVSAAVFRIRNLLELSGRPVLFDEIVVPVRRFPDLTERVFAERAGTIYGLYQERYGTSVIRIAERISAAVADAETARLLRVARGAALLRIARVAYTYDDVPVELRVSLVDTTEHEYFSDLFKP